MRRRRLRRGHGRFPSSVRRVDPSVPRARPRRSKTSSSSRLRGAPRTPTDGIVGGRAGGPPSRSGSFPRVSEEVSSASRRFGRSRSTRYLVTTRSAHSFPTPNDVCCSPSATRSALRSSSRASALAAESGVAGSSVVPTTRSGGAPAASSGRGASTGGTGQIEHARREVHEKGTEPRRGGGRVRLETLGRAEVTHDRSVETGDPPERIESVVPGAIRRPPHEAVGHPEQRRRVAVLRRRQRLTQALPARAAVVERFEHGGVEAGVVHGPAAAVQCVASGRRAARGAQRVVSDRRVASVVERAGRAAWRSRRRSRRARARSRALARASPRWRRQPGRSRRRGRAPAHGAGRASHRASRDTSRTTRRRTRASDPRAPRAGGRGRARCRRSTRAGAAPRAVTSARVHDRAVGRDQVGALGCGRGREALVEEGVDVGAALHRPALTDTRGSNDTRSKRSRSVTRQGVSHRLQPQDPGGAGTAGVDHQRPDAVRTVARLRPCHGEVERRAGGVAVVDGDSERAALERQSTRSPVDRRGRGTRNQPPRPTGDGTIVATRIAAPMSAPNTCRPRNRTASRVTAYAPPACASACCIRERWEPRSASSSLRARSRRPLGR